MILKLKTAPSAEPVSATEAKTHMRIDVADYDTYIGSLIKAARQHVESLCGPLITQSWYQYQDGWPIGDCLRIWKPRLLSVVAVKYTDSDAVTSTVSSSEYAVDTINEYAPRIVLKEDYEWPIADLYNVNPIEIEFTCGYGATSASVPEPIRQSILMLVSHWYEIREPVIVGQQIAGVPMSVDALITEYRVF